MLSNFISNAIKYAPGTPIHIEGVLQKERIYLSVKDSGPGMTQEQQEKVFEKFERGSVDRTVTGLGLGLFITRRIVQAHGGRVWVESAPEKGSKFIVELPRICAELQNT